MRSEERDAQIHALLLAITTLLADDRVARTADDSGVERTEIVLARAGLSAMQIGQIMGKQAGAVRMAISRARKKSGDGAEDDQ